MSNPSVFDSVWNWLAQNKLLVPLIIGAAIVIAAKIDKSKPAPRSEFQDEIDEITERLQKENDFATTDYTMDEIVELYGEDPIGMIGMLMNEGYSVDEIVELVKTLDIDPDKVSEETINDWLKNNDKGRESSWFETNPEGDLSVKDEAYYAKVLDISGRVNKSEIKIAYRKMVTLNHPDKLKQMDPKIEEYALRRMQEINEAYTFFKNKYNL
jgi:DnaJ-domain-containing protein 1